VEKRSRENLAEDFETPDGGEILQFETYPLFLRRFLPPPTNHCFGREGLLLPVGTVEGAIDYSEFPSERPHGDHVEPAAGAQAASRNGRYYGWPACKEKQGSCCINSTSTQQGYYQ